jgi:hypothetical protein
MKTIERERRDWIIVPIILLIGFMCVIVAGQWALRFSPNWKLNADMDSNLDPNRDFLTRRPSGFIEPVDPSILTEPVWINLFLTPGVSFITGTPFPGVTNTSSFTASTITRTPISIASATNTNVVIASPTNTFIYYPPTSSSTSQPKPTATSTASPVYTSTPTAVITVTQTLTPTPTQPSTATSTFTPTPTATATPTFTNTPTSTATPACSTTLTITGTSGSYPISPGLNCFDYTDVTFANGGIFQITSTGVDGMVNGSSCPGKSISSGSTIDYGVAQSGGFITFRIMGSGGTVDINISDWTTYPACP